MLLLNRRYFLIGALAMPAIVSANSLMPLRGIILPQSFAAPLLDMAITDARGSGETVRIPLTPFFVCCKPSDARPAT